MLHIRTLILVGLIFNILGTVTSAAEIQDEPINLIDSNLTTFSKETIDTAVINSLPVRSIHEILAIQNGVVAEYRPSSRWFRIDDSQWGERPERESLNGPELDIRGGYPYENGYYLNGVHITNQISGNMTMGISPHAIDKMDLYSGGIPAQYGLANAGIIDITTRSGTEKFSGMVEIVSDNTIGSDFDRNWYTASVGGPVTLLRNACFFGLVERRWLGDRNPSAYTEEALPGSPNRLPGNWLKGWSYNGRVDYHIRPELKLTLTADGSIDEWSEYRHAYLFDIEHTPYYKDKNLSLSAGLAHKISSDFKYSLAASYFASERFRGDGVHRENLLDYGRPNGSVYLDETGLFYTWDDPSTDVEYADYWVSIDTTMEGHDIITTDSVRHSFISGGDEGSIWYDYMRYKSSYLGLKGDFSLDMAEGRVLSGGFDIQRHTVRYYRHYNPGWVWRGLDNRGFEVLDRYGYDILGNESDSRDWRSDAKHPVNASGYLEYQVRTSSELFSIGLRLDYFDYDFLRSRNLEYPMDPDLKFDEYSNTLEGSDFERLEPLIRLSPRLGLGVMLKNDWWLFANVNMRYQNIPYANMYVGYDIFDYTVRYTELLVFLGTFDPKPEKVMHYEIGMKRQISPGINLRGSVYYRKGSDISRTYIQLCNYTRYFGFRNINESTVRGIELSLESGWWRIVSFDINYTLAYSDGYGPYTPPQVDTYRSPEAISFPLDFDQRHKLAGIAGFKMCEGEGPRWGNIYPLENTKFTLLIKAASGLRYTPMELENEASEIAYTPAESDYRNELYLPYTLNIDLEVEKVFHVGQYDIAVFTWIKNVLDRDNITSVWQVSGSPNSTGWLETEEGQDFIEEFSEPDRSGLTGEQKYIIKEKNPQHYSCPREVYFGLKVSF